MPRDRARPRPARADRVGVRARQRPHRAAREPRRGRAVRPARHLPGRLLRGPAAAVRRGRVRLPGGRARRSSTSPTARSSGCSSRTSRSTSATASCAATSGCSTCAPACSAAPPSGSRRPGALVRVSSTRLVSFTQRAVAAILYEVEPLDGPAPVVRAVGARRQRAGAGDAEGPARGRRACRAAALGVLRRRRTTRRCSCTRPRRAA